MWDIAGTWETRLVWDVGGEVIQPTTHVQDFQSNFIEEEQGFNEAPLRRRKQRIATNDATYNNSSIGQHLEQTRCNLSRARRMMPRPSSTRGPADRLATTCAASPLTQLLTSKRIVQRRIERISLLGWDPEESFWPWGQIDNCYDSTLQEETVRVRVSSIGNNRPLQKTVLRDEVSILYK